LAKINTDWTGSLSFFLNLNKENSTKLLKL
jgi:hypothetical protein